ncbi:cytochrome P450 monooxygenase 9 [Geranomyces variabilis]|uniref:peptidylprolyl isomerase n=1 Tax=Geranomyces variabilis TaxID=109894 RepID=A0AAD5TG02_9FUNG|nr:cytochrome P450 monooxygenase 9 [Geranomyces variabilis]
MDSQTSNSVPMNGGADTCSYGDDVKVKELEKALEAALSPASGWRDDDHNEFRQNNMARADDLEYHQPTTPDEDIYMDEGSFADIAAKILRKRYPNRESAFSRPLTEDDAQYLTTELRNFAVVTTYNPEFRRRYRVWAIDRRPACEIRIPLSEKEMAGHGESEGPTVAQYLKQRYGVDIAMENAPCIAVKKMQGMTYLPIEFCEMVPCQLRCTKEFEPKDPAMMWQAHLPGKVNADDAAGEHNGAQPKSKKKKAKALTEATDRDAAPAAEITSEQQHAAKLTQNELPAGEFDVPAEIWKQRKDVNVCLRCGHPSHRLLECELYGTPVREGAVDWKDVPAYVATGMEIPTQPKMKLSKKCGISNTQWHRRREMGLCGRCAHPGHGLRECKLLKDPEFAYDGSHTWIDVPEYLADSTAGDGPDYGRIPNGYIWEHGRFWPENEDDLPAAPPAATEQGTATSIVAEQYPQAAPTVLWNEEAQSKGPGGNDGAEGQTVSSEENKMANRMLTKTPDADGYVHLSPEGKLKKRIKKEGSGSFIAAHSVVEVHYTGWILEPSHTGMSHDSTPFDGSREGVPFEYIHGDGQVLPAWEEVVGTMRPGEQAEIICSPEYAYGDEGVDDKVPPQATLKFELEILNVTPPPDPVFIRLADAEGHKTRGNEYFKTGKYSLAQEAYEDALTRLGPSWGSSVVEHVEISQLRATLNANLALSYLRTNDCNKALAATKQGLLHAPRSTKLWYRQAQAAKALQMWDLAEKAAQTALELDPSDKDVISFLEGTPAARQAQVRAEKQVYAAMFGVKKAGVT